MRLPVSGWWERDLTKLCRSLLFEMHRRFPCEIFMSEKTRISAVSNAYMLKTVRTQGLGHGDLEAASCFRLWT